MKTIRRQFHDEIHPESQEDVERLKRTYPHLWPFSHVCVMHKPRERTLVELRDMYIPRHRPGAQQRYGT